MVAAVLQGIMAGAQGGLFTELFPVRVRYSGISIAYQMGGMSAARSTRSSRPRCSGRAARRLVALYLTALCVASLVAAIMLPSGAANRAETAAPTAATA